MYRHVAASLETSTVSYMVVNMQGRGLSRNDSKPVRAWAKRAQPQGLKSPSWFQPLNFRQNFSPVPPPGVVMTLVRP